MCAERILLESEAKQSRQAVCAALSEPDVRPEKQKQKQIKFLLAPIRDYELGWPEDHTVHTVKGLIRSIRHFLHTAGRPGGPSVIFCLFPRNLPIELELSSANDV